MQPEAILGLTALEPYGMNMHSSDSSACMVDKGKVVGAVSEERFTRTKHHASLPSSSINYLLSLGYNYPDVDAVAIPWPLKRSDRNLKDFARSIYQNFFPKIKKKIDNLPFLPVEKKKIVGIGYQSAHAAAAYRTSGFRKALIVSLNIGGAEEDNPEASGGIFVGEGTTISKLHNLTPSFGMFFSYVSQGLGFTPLEGEGKTTALAAYGEPRTKAYDYLGNFAPTVKGVNLVQAKKKVEGQIAVFNNLQRIVFNDLDRIYSASKQYSDKDVAAAAQLIVEARVTQLVTNALEETGMDRLCLSGDVFSNVKLNKRLSELKRVKEIYINPNPGAAGACVGAALEAYHSLTGEKTSFESDSVYLGPAFSNAEIEAELKKYRGVSYVKTSDPSGDAAELISRGRIVGWFQGRVAWNPHGLGARSVLASPHDSKVKEKINKRLKHRDWFVPFSPAILSTETHNYLRNPSDSPYMMRTFDVLPHASEEIAATIHVDGTVRPQTVDKEQNPLYYDLIKEYDKMTGVPVVLNTSFNRHDFPVVCTPSDVIQHLFMRCTEQLVIGNFIAKLK